MRLAWSFPNWRPFTAFRSPEPHLVRVETGQGGYWMGSGGVLVVGWVMLWWLIPRQFVSSRGGEG